MAVPFGSVVSADLPRHNRRRNRFFERFRHNAPTAEGTTGRSPGKLLFDPLEPRLLLSADVLSVNLAQAALAGQDHNLVVEMVNATVQVGNTAQNVQRVEVVDQANNNAVLAVGNLSVIKQISIVGDANSAHNDTVTINLDSFGGHAAPAVAFQGGGGTNTLVFDPTASPGGASEQWQLTGAKSGTATGLDNLKFSNVDSITGSGADVLTATTATNTWNVTGAGAGTVNGLAFAGFGSLQGGANTTDTFVFSPGASLSGGVGGGANRTNTLQINDGAGSTENWQLTGANSGAASGAVNVGFSNIQNLVGGAGWDVLDGPISDTTWSVTGNGSGTAAGVGFTGFERLVGAANNQDTFVFSPGGAISGGIDGGAGGFDTLVLNGNYDTVVMNPTDGSSGSVTLDGNTIQYAGLEPIMNTGTVANMVFDLPDGSTAAVLSAATTAGFLTLSDPGSAETTTFRDPTGSLTINLGQGVITGNTLTIQSLDSAFAAGLIVASQDAGSIADAITGSFFIPLSNNTVNVDTNVSTDGGEFSINAATVNVQAGVTIDTRSPTASSGEIRIAGPEGSTQGPHNVTIGSGAVLDANAFNSSVSAGNITIEVSDQNYRPIELPIAYSQKSVGITLTGATVEGGDITITAEATDISLASEVPLFAKASPARSPTCLRRSRAMSSLP
jgi:hypothetical protein